MKKVRVEFKRSNGEKIVIGYCTVSDDIETGLNSGFKIINHFLEQFPNFKSYYTRVNGPREIEGKPRFWNIDVGSWSEFFYLTEEDEEVADDYFEDLNVRLVK